MNSIFEITLKSIEVAENGYAVANEGENFFSASLFYPKEGIPSVETIKKLALKDKEIYQFDSHSYREKLLFKQSFQGESEIEITLTAKEKITKFEKILKAAAQGGFIAGFGTLTGGAGIAIATGIIKSATDSIFKLGEQKDKLNIIGTGCIPINSDITEGTFSIDLKVPENLTLVQIYLAEGKVVERKKLLKKELINARVVLDIKKIKLSNIPVA